MIKHSPIIAVTVLIALLMQSVACAKEPDAILRTAQTDKALEYHFDNADSEMLEEIQRGCFLYFWKEVGEAGLAKDRRKAPVASTAAVGFQLSALPIGVEHGWITREQGAERAKQILSALISRKDNKHEGIYYHFVDYDTGGHSSSGYEELASTIDSALLMAGAIPSAEYFKGDVAKLVDRLLAEADWTAFSQGARGELSMGWYPHESGHPEGKGTFHKALWECTSCEERITYFVAISAPTASHALDAKIFYGLKRPIGQHRGMPPYVISPQGTMFHYFFSHCWIDFRHMQADDPGLFGMNSPRVDWFENSRRATLTHRSRCLENAGRFKTFGGNRWGQSACAARDGYVVPHVKPNMANADCWADGTVAPYAAGAAIMFTPEESIAALREYRNMKFPNVWWDPADGGYGFVDCFNIDQNFASDDYVGIDHGPLLLGIENARTGLIWKLFMRSETAKRGVKRLKLSTR